MVAKKVFGSLVLAVVIALAAGLAVGATPLRRAEDGNAAPDRAAETPLGTEFTYQGRLTGTDGRPVEGTCDFQFSLWDAPDAVSPVAGPLDRNGVLLKDGLFTVQIGYGPVFDGTALWLEVAVKCGSEGTYTVLIPRQPLTAAPYALYSLTAGNADLLDGRQAADFWSTGGNAGTVAGTHVLGTVDPVTLTLVVGAAPGLRLGPGMPTHNVIGGSGANWVTAGTYGGTIGGGGENGAPNGVTDAFGVVGGGWANQAGDNAGTVEDRLAATVGGGYQNTASGRYATVSGGWWNRALGDAAMAGGGHANVAEGGSSFVGGGYDNHASGGYAAIGGGFGNAATGSGAFVGGGWSNTASGGSATVAGGDGNVAQGADSFAGGWRAKAWHDGSFVWSDASGCCGSLDSTAANQFLVRATGGVSFTTFGAPFRINGQTAWHAGNDGAGSGLNADLLDGYHAAELAGSHNHDGSYWKLTGNAGTAPGADFLGTTDAAGLTLVVSGTAALRLYPNAVSPNLVGGYAGNWITAGVQGATIGGGGASGRLNRVTDEYSTVGGGRDNQAGNADADPINAGYTTVSGGAQNVAGAHWAAVGGGYGNQAIAQGTTISGGSANWATGNWGTVGGGYHNQAMATYVTVGGGRDNGTFVAYATVGGGWNNRAEGTYATIGGGLGNLAYVDYATIAGGGRTNPDDWSTGNRVYDIYGTVGGGGNNVAGRNDGWLDWAKFATVAGGESNQASGQHAAVPGGQSNTAQGNYSFAAGRRAKANHDGAFVWADSTNADFASARSNQFAVRATGGVSLTVNSGQWVEVYSGTALITTSVGAFLSSGGAWTNASDRALKEGFSAVDGQEVLARLAEVPIATWSYRSQAPAIRHMGPTAQDFYAAFGLGEDERHIATVDTDGVALAAIQGLYAENQALKAENAAQQAQIDGLAARLAALEGQAEGSRSGLPLPWLVAGGLVAAGGVAAGRRKR